MIKLKAAWKFQHKYTLLSVAILCDLLFPVFHVKNHQMSRNVVGLERVHSASWVQLRSYLEEKVEAPV
jgi:hypothetical protein